MRHRYAVMAALCLFLNVRCAEIENGPTDESVKENLTNEGTPNVEGDGTHGSGSTKPPTHPALPVITPDNLSEYVTSDIQPTTKPEKYMVYFAWPKLSQAKKIRIRMEQNLAIVEPTQTTFSHEVNHDQTLTYTFDVLDELAKVQGTFSKQVKIPRDLVIRQGQSEMTENVRITANRIFMKDVPLRTNGFNVELIANELIADHAIIETFPDGAKAPRDFSGKHGGELSLKIGSARGVLKVFMRGQNGGDGSPGAPYSSRAPAGANAGANAGDGYQECDCVGRACLLMGLSQEIQPQRIYCSCIQTGNNAGNGAAGAKGRDGRPAGQGGNTGVLRVSIKDGKEFDLQTYKYVGQPGSPGAGGPGQQGGAGGDGKRSDNYKDCRGWGGSDGPNGAPGNPGPRAIEGKQHLICIYIASEGKNDCY